MPTTAMVTAAATVSLTGPLALQGRQAARGLELWASTDQIQLRVVDDAGSATTACNAYRRWLGGQVDLLLGPYGSGLVRQVGPIVSQQGALLWNHGGSADDLTKPLVVPVSAPASTYFRGAVELARRRGLSRVVCGRDRDELGGYCSAYAFYVVEVLGIDGSFDWPIRYGTTRISPIVRHLAPRCYLCGEAPTEHAEHVIPIAVGAKIPRVCTVCSSSSGPGSHHRWTAETTRTPFRFQK